jgi:CRP-like cAMP-binding protein
MRQVDGELLLDELGIDHLKNAATFGALSDEAIAYLMKNGRIHVLRKGERLIETGKPSGSFFIVLKGSLAYYQALNNHSEHIYDFHFGEAIGFVSMIALTPWPGTTIATSNSHVLEVTSDLFYSMHCEKPLDFGVLLINLSRELARRVLTLIEMVAELKSTKR